MLINQSHMGLLDLGALLGGSGFVESGAPQVSQAGSLDFAQLVGQLLGGSLEPIDLLVQGSEEHLVDGSTKIEEGEPNTIDETLSDSVPAAAPMPVDASADVTSAPRHFDVPVLDLPSIAPTNVQENAASTVSPVAEPAPVVLVPLGQPPEIAQAAPLPITPDVTNEPGAKPIDIVLDGGAPRVTPPRPAPLQVAEPLLGRTAMPPIPSASSEALTEPSQTELDINIEEMLSARRIAGVVNRHVDRNRAEPVADGLFHERLIGRPNSSTEPGRSASRPIESLSPELMVPKPIVVDVPIELAKVAVATPLPIHMKVATKRVSLPSAHVAESDLVLSEKALPLDNASILPVHEKVHLPARPALPTEIDGPSPRSIVRQGFDSGLVEIASADALQPPNDLDLFESAAVDLPETKIDLHPQTSKTVVSMSDIGEAFATTAPSSVRVLDAAESPTAQPVIATRQQVGRVVSERIVEWLGSVDGPQGSFRMEVRLHPRELGHVKVEMDMRAHQIDLQVTVESEEAKLLVQSHLGDLKQTMDSRGYSLSQVSVHVSGDGAGANQENSPNQPAAQTGYGVETDGDSDERRHLLTAESVDVVA